MLALPRRASFWPLSMAYISVIITHVTNYNFSWYRPSVGGFHVLHQHLSFWLVGTYIHSCCTSVCVVLNLIYSISFDLLVRLPTACSNRPLRVALPERETPWFKPTADSDTDSNFHCIEPQITPSPWCNWLQSRIREFFEIRNLGRVRTLES